MKNTPKSPLQGVIEHLERAGAYMSARASEGSTWAGITAAIVGAATLTPPYSYLAIAAGVIGVFAKSKTRDEAL